MNQRASTSPQQISSLAIYLPSFFLSFFLFLFKLCLFQRFSCGKYCDYSLSSVLFRCCSQEKGERLRPGFIFCNRDLRSRFVDGANALFRCFWDSLREYGSSRGLGYAYTGKLYAFFATLFARKVKNHRRFDIENCHTHTHTRARSRARDLYSQFVFCCFFL